MDTTIPLPPSGRMQGLALSRDDADYAQVFDALLRRALDRRASDVHLVTHLPPILRIDGELIPEPGDALTSTELQNLIFSKLTPSQQEELERTRQLCVSIKLEEVCHFRLTVYFQLGCIEAAIRVSPLSIKTPRELGLPPILEKLIEKKSGLILITGPTGAGKTTTLNCIIDMINRNRRAKIITVEDPVEFIHENRLGIVVQQQLHSDVTSFASALVHILRQDPDVIGIGEMRDLETISTALTAAETGHLVIATLHTPDATSTLDRIVDAFPGDQQSQTMIQLATCLQAIVAQQLLPRIDREGRVLATEVMIANTAIKNLIRERKAAQIRNAIETSARDGMHLMDHSLRDLYQQGIITYEVAVAHASSADAIGGRRDAAGAQPVPANGIGSRKGA